jgi:hypothetical protein
MILALVGTFNPLNDAEAFTIFRRWRAANANNDRDWRVIDSRGFVPKSDDINVEHIV